MAVRVGLSTINDGGGIARRVGVPAGIAGTEADAPAEIQPFD
jgi:hypothetical protein